MSFSLSSLLNPSPDADTAPPPPASDSLPSAPCTHSPEQQNATSPRSAHGPQYGHEYSRGSESEAVHALAALGGSGGTAPPPLQSQWYGQVAPGSSHERRSNSYEQRPGSGGYNDAVQLPPPSPSAGRKPSSPTLDQYHVASRSPEERKASILSPTQAGVTLPPIQNMHQSSADYATRQLNAYHPPSPIANLAANSEGTASKQESALVAPNSSAATKGSSSPPANIKQETSLASSPAGVPRADVAMSEPESHNVRAISSLKNEHGLRTQSPLRESSVPVPSTEQSPLELSVSKKRPAPSKNKKGTATATKKAPPAKKRKVEPKRSVTPSSRASKPFTLMTGSSIGTPADSSPAPSTRSQSDYEDPDDDDEDMDDGDADGDVYCICRKPDTGTFMIGCDGTCDDWFHGKCVGIEERDKNLIDKYVCPNCTKAGAGKTTWKRICRRVGCRLPARVGKTKGGKDGSKYCSEECGVAYFREMVARTRGKEELLKNRSSRRKGSIDRGSIDYDLGARGGKLAAGELKSLINSSATADDFKKLGEGVLSPPATPDSHKDTAADFPEPEIQALQLIHRQKEDARRKHQLLKDRMKFVTLIKQAALRTAAEKDLKPKEYCGYDSRLEWTDDRFEQWRNSSTGNDAFELETLAPEKTHEASGKDDEEEAEYEVCDRKKCARHLEWTKLAVDDVRFEMSDNSDRMRALEKEEKEVRERAALRAKAGSLNGEGSVEVHGLGIAVDQGREMNGVVETVEEGVA